ncbi:MAG: GGDEF domain-containing protein [Anaerolineales bacterium]|nr:GGDEF domain-containing protein [Anaerolineales bacterium]
MIELVKVVRERIRGSDWFARWGGEEFVILAPGINLDQAAILAGKICSLVSSHAFPSVVHITISMGVTQYQPGDTPEKILEKVDAALYQAKKRGGAILLRCTKLLLARNIC